MEYMYTKLRLIGRLAGAKNASFDNNYSYRSIISSSCDRSMLRRRSVSYIQ